MEAALGRPQFEDLAFVQRTSKASPKLFLACATGQHVKTAVLTARKAGKAQLEYLTIKLGDVLVASFQESGAVGTSRRSRRHPRLREDRDRLPAAVGDR